MSAAASGARPAARRDLGRLNTERRNPRSSGLDRLPTTDLLTVMNDEDATVAGAVRAALPQVAEAVEAIAAALAAGGRLVYVGAGTSGRLALLDAAECPPTFSTDPGQVIALLAGGEQAFTRAIEGAEDDTEQPARDLDAAGVSAADVVVGLTASGRTPYVIAALDHASSLGARTVSIACNPGSAVGGHADIAIDLDTGPEVLTGSTRLKAGTAQKLVCNMLTTGAMVRLGKVFDNLMVDMAPTNAKLVDRARRIVAAAAEVDDDTAAAALAASDGSAKVAIVHLLTGLDPQESRARLAEHGDRVGLTITDR